ncbi:leucine-rich repeat protein [Acetivibrio ethanolgignens]|nr:leucine-rich repeat protein [Acetivibrio ethanolgignens]
MEQREKGRGNTWRKGRITQRILSLILSVCMAVVLLPVTAKAEDAVETPTFSVDDGTEFTGSQEITISCATDGATIYYTLDGSTPSSTAGKVYESPITIFVTSKVQAIAVKDGVASAVASATCTRTDVQLSGYCGKEGDNLTWVIDNSGTLTISGQGEMVDEVYGIWYMSTESNLVKKIVIQSGVTSLGKCAFRNCKLATEITIPDTVTSIGEKAFLNCQTITNITIPASVTSIGICAFGYCSALETITVDAGNTVYKSEGNCIIEINTNKLIAGCKTSTIPDSVTSIEAYAFYYMPINSNFTLPNSITSIGEAAFMYSETLTSITLPSSLKQIGNSAFWNCEKLTAVVIPASVESIGYRAFGSCTSLESVTFSEGSSLKSIGIQAFGWCKALESITIPASVENMGERCFNLCSGLTTVNIADGSGLNTIGDAPFYNCTALTTITMKDNGTFYTANGCLFEKNEDGSVKRLIYGFEVTLPTDEGYAVAAEDGNSRYVGRNGSFSFTVTPAAGYNKNVVVKANSSSLTAENGVYTISNITANQTVTLEGAGECTHEGATFSLVESNTKHKCSLCDKVLDHQFVLNNENPAQHKCSACGYAEAHAEIQYQANDSAHTISASCSECGDLGTITLAAPAGYLSYTGEAKAATVSGAISGITTPDITYAKSDGTDLGTTAPKDAGTYTASITLGEGDGAKTVSVTYEITKAAASVGTVPSAKPDLTYNGNAQALVVAESNVTGGTWQYSTSQNGTYSSTIPAGKDAGEYSVWYKVVGDDNHSDTTPVEIKVTIAPLTITNENTTINLGTPLTYTGAEQTQSIASVTVGTLILGAEDYTVSGNTGTDARNDYILTVKGTGNFTGTATETFPISKKSLTGTNQALLVKTNQEKEITYDLSKLLPEGVTGETTYAVGTISNDKGVLSSDPANADISDGKLTLHVASVADADQTAIVQITFTNSNYAISAATLTIKTTDKTPVTLSGVTCGNRVYNAAAYAYTGTPVWKTAEGEIAVGETTVTYYKADNLSTPVEAPTNVGSYLAVFTITSDDYVGSETYNFEITKAQITVAAKDKNIYVGDAVPNLTTPVSGTDYSVTGLCGTDALGGTAAMSYGQEPDNTKDGTYEILISGLTAPEGDNYTIIFTNGTLTITTKPSGGGGSSSGGSTGGGSSSGGSTGEVTTGKDSGSNVTTTTSPTEVQVENGTASATVKAANVTEAIKQAADNQSAEIVFTVSEKDTGNADNIQLTMTTSDVKQILDKTDADLVVATTAGDVILPQEVLKEAVSAAGGNTITIEIDKVTMPTDVQKEAAGENSYIVEVTIASQNKAITTFGGNTLRIRLEIPAALVGKDVAVIHIAEDGKTEKMPGKTITEGTKQYYEFTTTYLSTFALVDNSTIEEETPAVTAPKKGTLLTDSKTKMVYKVTKSGTTGGTVQFVKTKNTKAKTVAIPDKVTIDGITYKVTSIAANALKNNKTVTTVTIGKYVTSIGSNAFYGCSKLKKVTIGKSVTTIGSKAFYKCTSLTSITIPSKVTKIGNYAFKGCTKLKTIKINTTLLTTKTVSQYAFSGVSTSAVVKVPKSKNKTYKKLLVKKGLSKKVTIKNL